MNMRSFFLSKQFSAIISLDVTITARGFFMRGKEKWNFLTYTGEANTPKLCTVAHGVQLSTPMRIYKTFTR